MLYRHSVQTKIENYFHPKHSPVLVEQDIASIRTRREQVSIRSSSTERPGDFVVTTTANNSTHVRESSVSREDLSEYLSKVADEETTDKIIQDHSHFQINQ